MRSPPPQSWLSTFGVVRKPGFIWSNQPRNTLRLPLSPSSVNNRLFNKSNKPFVVCSHLLQIEKETELTVTRTNLINREERNIIEPFTEVEDPLIFDGLPSW